MVPPCSQLKFKTPSIRFRLPLGLKKDIEKYIENVRCVDNAVKVVAVYVL